MNLLADTFGIVSQMGQVLASALGGTKAPAPETRQGPTKGEAAMARWLGWGSPLPQAWTADRYAQVQRYRGWVYIGMQAWVREFTKAIPQVAYVRTRQEAEQRKRLGKKCLPPYLRRKALAQVSESEELEPAPWDHPLRQILRNPNGPDTHGKFWPRIVLSLLTGNAYLRVVDNDLGLPMELWSMPPHWMRPGREEDSKQLVDWWEVWPTGTGNTARDRIPARQIIHVPLAHPWDYLDGYSPLAAGAPWIDADEAQAIAQLASMLEGIHPDVILGTEEGAGPYTNEQIDEIQNRINERHRGVSRRGRTLILQQMKVLQASRSPSDMEFQSGYEIGRDRILALFGVGKSIAGLAEDTNFACHDAETELLTRRGWLKYDQLSVDDVAGTMNPATGAFEWQALQAVHVHDYDGEMVRVRSRNNFDLLVTPNHRIWATRRQRYFLDGRDVREGLQPYRFIRADEITSGTILPLACGAKEGVPIECFDLPGVEHGRKYLAPGRHPANRLLPMSPWLEFLGWWVSEGWSVNRPRGKNGGGNYVVSVSQKASSATECAAIDAAITGLPWNVNQWLQKDGMHKWQIVDKSLWTWLRENCGTGSYSKRLPAFVDDLPALQQRPLLDALILGDGCETRGGSYCYFTVSEQLAGQVQALAIQCGLIAHRCKTMSSGVMPISIRPTSTWAEALDRHIGREHYCGTVWCATVPNGLLVTRRNGKSIITGNSAIAARANFIDRTIVPLLSLVAGILSEQLARRFDERLIVYYDSPALADPQQVNADLQADLKAGAITPNEARALRGREPYTPDQEPNPGWGDKPMIFGPAARVVEEDKESEGAQPGLPPAKGEGEEQGQGTAQTDPLEDALGKLDKLFRPRRKGGDFNESDHPRADDGRFGSGGGGSDTSASNDSSAGEQEVAAWKERQEARDNRRGELEMAHAANAHAPHDKAEANVLSGSRILASDRVSPGNADNLATPEARRENAEKVRRYLEKHASEFDRATAAQVKTLASVGVEGKATRRVESARVAGKAAIERTTERALEKAARFHEAVEAYHAASAALDTQQPTNQEGEETEGADGPDLQREVEIAQDRLDDAGTVAGQAIEKIHEVYTHHAEKVTEAVYSAIVGALDDLDEEDANDREPEPDEPEFEEEDPQKRPTRLRRKGSFFGECDRDEQGHCKPGTGGGGGGEGGEEKPAGEGEAKPKTEREQWQARSDARADRAVALDETQGALDDMVPGYTEADQKVQDAHDRLQDDADVNHLGDEGARKAHAEALDANLAARASTLASHADAHTAALEKVGADTSKVKAAAQKGQAALEKAGAKCRQKQEAFHQASAKAGAASAETEAAQKALDAHEASEPQQPEDTPYPTEPEEPDTESYEDPAYVAYEAEHAKWEAETEKIDAGNEKASDQWYRAHGRWEREHDTLSRDLSSAEWREGLAEQRAESARGAFLEAHDAVSDTAQKHGDTIAAAAGKALADAQDDLEEEEKSDQDPGDQPPEEPEPEEDDSDDDEEPEDDKAVHLANGRGR